MKSRSTTPQRWQHYHCNRHKMINNKINKTFHHDIFMKEPINKNNNSSTFDTNQKSDKHHDNPNNSHQDNHYNSHHNNHLDNHHGNIILHTRGFFPLHATLPAALHWRVGVLGDCTRRKSSCRTSSTPLKAWLLAHRDNPYPTKREKVSASGI